MKRELLIIGCIIALFAMGMQSYRKQYVDSRKKESAIIDSNLVHQCPSGLNHTDCDSICECDGLGCVY